MYTPRALLSRLFLKICVCVLSLYIVGRLVTLPCKISSHLHHYRLESEDKVWSVYIHTVNWIMRLWGSSEVMTKRRYTNLLLLFKRFGHFKFSKMAIGRHLGFDRTGNGAVRTAVSENPTLEQTWSRSDDALQSYGHLNFLENVWIGHEVGRSVVNIHTSYTDLIYSSFARNVARARSNMIC